MNIHDSNAQNDYENSKNLLVVCGTGRVNIALVRIAKLIGFTIWLVDNSSGDNTDEISKLADKYIKVESYEADLKKMDIPKNAYLVTSAADHDMDGEVLTGVLDKNLAYVGMMASKKTIERLFGELLARGFSQSDLDKIYTPIGIDLGCKTHEEIALSVMAQIVMVKNGIVM